MKHSFFSAGVVSCSSISLLPHFFVTRQVAKSDAFDVLSIGRRGLPEGGDRFRDA
jgi:hypothetical protein